MIRKRIQDKERFTVKQKERAFARVHPIFRGNVGNRTQSSAGTSRDRKEGWQEEGGPDFSTPAFCKSLVVNLACITSPFF